MFQIRWAPLCLGLGLLFVSPSRQAFARNDFIISNSSDYTIVNINGLDLGGELYIRKTRPGADYVYVQRFDVQADFSSELRDHLDQVEAGRKKILESLGISKYWFVSHGINPSPFRDFKEFDSLHIQYRDELGRVHHSIERQYVIGSRAYVISYITHLPSLSDSDFDQIDKALDQIKPRLYAGLGGRFALFSNVELLLIGSAYAQVDVAYPYQSMAPQELADFNAGQNKANIACINGAGKGAVELGKDIVSLAETANPIGIAKRDYQIAAGLAPVIAEFYKNPKAVAGQLSTSILTLVKQHADKTKRFFCCVSPEKVLS